MSKSPPPRPRPTRSPDALLRRLEWTVMRRLDGLLHGDYKTLFRGFGLDLADIREYQYGDDVRHIDWNVTARLQTPYVREYYEDREVTAWFLLDLSRSIDFGSEEVDKRSLGLEFVALLARLLTRHGNRVGATFYGREVDYVLPPRSGRRQVLALLHAIGSRPKLPEGEATRLGDLLKAGLNLIRRRSLVFVVSDFISAPGWEKPLAQLARRNEMIGVRLHDPLESELPDLGLLVFQDAETGEQVFVDTHDKGFRRRFAAVARTREEAIRSALSDAGVDALELSTGANLVDTVMRFANLRKRRGNLRVHELPVA